MAIHQAYCKSTKSYFIDSSEGLLMFDAGWPGEYRDLRDNLKVIGMNIKNVKSFIVSHFHMDHAGLAGLFVQNGVKFVVFENQLKNIDTMEELITRKKYDYQMIDKQQIHPMKISDSRKWLKSLGIDGEVIQMFGHEDQSITLLIDSGEAFIGDLPIEQSYDDLVKQDWINLRTHNVKHIYPAHANNFDLE